MIAAKSPNSSMKLLEKSQSAGGNKAKLNCSKVENVKK